jgi:hypothetical protein
MLTLSDNNTHFSGSKAQVRNKKIITIATNQDGNPFVHCCCNAGKP